MSLEHLNLVQNLTSNLLTVCPKTDQQMSVSNFAFQPVTDDTQDVVVKWHCPKCREWHITVYKGSKEND